MLTADGAIDDRDLAEQAARIETLLGEIESFPDAGMRARATEIVQGLLLLYGEGLARMLGIVDQRTSEETRDTVFESFAADDLVSHLLLLHDLHPIDLETRILRALDEVRPYLASHGGNVELIGVFDGVARLRLQGSCSGCPSSTMTLKLAIDEAIQKAAPDLEGIEAEGVAEPPPRPVGFVPISDLLPKREPANGAGPKWVAVERLPNLLDGETAALEIAGRSILFCKVEENLYAYGNTCARCGEPLGHASLNDSALTCPACAQRYDVRHAGGALDDPDVHLSPIPLLVRDEAVRIAVTGG